ncbi:MAG: hypothetical protein KBD51_00160 [Candidatus Levybacteria bacterium]|nr:hypothetical protein [Candidatus Levybacteria bacterium]
MAEGEGFISRVLNKFGGRPSHDVTPTSLQGTSTPDQTTPQDPTLGRANVLDEASRTFGATYTGAPRMTPPTAEGLAKAKDAVASAQPTPPTPGTPTQGS